MFYDDLIKAHYKKVSSLYGLNSSSTMEDRYIRKSEIDFILCELSRFIPHYSGEISLLDVGCGNAYLLQVIQETYPYLHLAGLEFSPELYQLACDRNLTRAKIIEGDIRKPLKDVGHFDIVVTERVLINLLNKKHQYQALKNIVSLLPLGGRYIMVESFKEPLVNLNKARMEMGLKALKESYQNLYLSEGHIDHLKKLGMKELVSPTRPNFLSTYFYLSRALHKVQRPSGGRVKDSEFVKFFTTGLPDGVGNYSQILFRVFEKE